MFCYPLCASSRPAPNRRSEHDDLQSDDHELKRFKETDQAPPLEAAAFDVLKHEVDQSYRMIQDPTLNDRHSSCLSCHVTGALRKVFDLTGVGPVVKDPANMNPSQRGPGGVGQIEFSQQWVLRVLGYLGRMPWIGDRLVSEVEADLARLNGPAVPADSPATSD